MELKYPGVERSLLHHILLIAPLMELKSINRKYSRKEYMSFNRTAYGIEIS
mgnify:FL=1